MLFKCIVNVEKKKVILTLLEFFQNAYKTISRPTSVYDFSVRNTRHVKVLHAHVLNVDHVIILNWEEFIMLENLVCRYDKPCMLDLKMGQRQYGDDSSVEKRKLLEARCAKSTSSSLGFRICGTQVNKSNVFSSSCKLYKNKQIEK